MEHLLLGGVPAGDELHVVHEEHVGAPVLLPELRVAPLSDGLDELVGEGVPLDVDHLVLRVVFVDGVGDGVQQVGLAQTGLPIDEQGVIALARVVGHRPGGGVGKFVGGAHHEALEGVLLGAGEEIVLLRLAVLVQLPLGEHHHVHVAGEQLPQGGLDLPHVAGGDDVPLEAGGRVEDETVVLQGDSGGVVKPGVDGGGGHIRLHQSDDLGPDIGGRIHERNTSLQKNNGRRA